MTLAGTTARQTGKDKLIPSFQSLAFSDSIQLGNKCQNDKYVHYWPVIIRSATYLKEIMKQVCKDVYTECVDSEKWEIY